METPTQELSWKPLVLTTQADIDKLWEKVQQFPQVFDDFSAGKKEIFVQRLLAPNNIFLDIGDGLGVAAGFNVRPRLDAVIHLVMFDRRLRGREAVFLDIMRHFFDKLQLRRLTSIVTSDSPMTIRLAERLGFKEEGIIRQSVLRGGKYIDSHIYGMLKEELP